MKYRSLVASVVLQSSLFAALASAQSLWPWQLESKLIAPDADAGDRAGSAIAAHSTLLLVGAPDDDEAGVDAGAVYTYYEAGGSWVYGGKLLAPAPRPSGHFGFAIALDGDTALIGSPSLTNATPGDAWLFHWDGTAWAFEARLQPPSGAASFGKAVAIAQDVAAVAEPNISSLVRVYARSGTAWPQVQTVQSAGPTNVALEGDTMLVTDIGFVRAYHRASTGLWFSTEIIPGPINQGVAMDIHGDVCAITRPTGGVGYWFVDVYDFDSSTTSHFVKSATLASDDQQTITHDRFGQSLAFARDDAHDAELLVVGAPQLDFAAQHDGMAHVFTRLGKQWLRVARIAAPDAAADDEFGQGVAIAGSHVIVGAWQSDALAADSGAVYSYALATAPTVYCTSKVNSIGCAPRISGVGVPSSSAGSGFQVGCVDSLPKKFGVLFYSRTSTLLPFRGGWLCVESPLKRAAMQTSDGTDFCTGTYSVDLNVYLASGQDPALVPGAAVACQWATRDPADPFGSGLSDALWFQIGP